jgi:succinate-semialdehyde dehydrogenase/glutarate-semialdehyde dehydrogenase
VLADADLDAASDAALVSRFQNGGQSCIAAKRIILLPEIAERFMALFSAKVATLEVGDPLCETTRVGPLARVALRDALDRQVAASIAAGAVPVTGCRPLPGGGAFYAPSILDHVTSAAPAYHEELFGPVAAILRASDEEDALRLANDTRFGLGASVWSADARRAEALLQDIESGLAFVNGVVKSDPRLPFGGVKASGHGRELSYHGVREFVNARAVWRR